MMSTRGPYLSDLPVLYQENIRLAAELVWAEAKLEDIHTAVETLYDGDLAYEILNILNRKEPDAAD